MREERAIGQGDPRLDDAVDALTSEQLDDLACRDDHARLQALEADLQALVEERHDEIAHARDPLSDGVFTRKTADALVALADRIQKENEHG